VFYCSKGESFCTFYFLLLLSSFFFLFFLLVPKWPDPNTLPDWDLDVERKRLMWKPFWDRIMEQDTELAGLPAEEPKEGETKKKKKKQQRRMSLVKAPDGTAVPFAAQRFLESKEKLRTRGFDAWENGLTPDPTQLTTKNELQLQWEGLDIFCDDKWQCDAGCSIAKDGKVSSSNGKKLQRWCCCMNEIVLLWINI
tara:strand:- start:61 stop:648 length:588 start_codon:yes stop_codon:yes gene_type:complete